MKDQVELNETFPHPPQRLWAALTESRLLGKWLMPTDFQPLIGFRFRLDRPSGSAIKGKVIEVEEGKLLAYTWNDEDEGFESKVVWKLEPVDGGTRLHLEHIPVENPEVTCLVVDNYFNWMYALRHGLPGLLQILAHQPTGRSPRAPIVYLDETLNKEKITK